MKKNLLKIYESFFDDLDKLLPRIEKARMNKEAVSIAYHGAQ